MSFSFWLAISCTSRSVIVNGRQAFIAKSFISCLQMCGVREYYNAQTTFVADLHQFCSILRLIFLHDGHPTCDGSYEDSGIVIIQHVQTLTYIYRSTRNTKFHYGVSGATASRRCSSECSLPFRAHSPLSPPCWASSTRRFGLCGILWDASCLWYSSGRSALPSPARPLTSFRLALTVFARSLSSPNYHAVPRIPPPQRRHTYTYRIPISLL